MEEIAKLSWLTVLVKHAVWVDSLNIWHCSYFQFPKI